MHMVAMGSQVINSTVVNNPQFHQMLPEGLEEVIQSTLDNAYLYGREWLSGMVCSIPILIWLLIIFELKFSI